MELPDLLQAMSQPRCYPFAVAEVLVLQTHISAVFLAGPFVYKVKKPVNLGFLDFSSLEKRRHDCEEEVRLNRRLAASVYLGVVPITRAPSGLNVEGEGEPIEWAVKMRRLPDDATLLEHLNRGQVSSGQIAELGRRIAEFHRHAESNAEVASYGRFEVVANNARENFEQCQAHVNRTVSPAVFARLQHLTDEALARLEPVIEARARMGRTRDTHGDLHADHIYLFPDHARPDDLVIIDCIEFNKRFRFADPVADIAFLFMDLKFRGHAPLAREMATAYFTTAEDDEGRSLLPFYSAYRAIVRAKVEGFELGAAEIPEEEKRLALARARAHWLLALGELESPQRRPCLILVGGLPGTGKSTLAQMLGNQIGAEVIRSDVVRKQLAGVDVGAKATNDFYSREWTERAYAECRYRAERLIFAGERVIVDASFTREAHRRDLLELAARYCVPAIMFRCHAERDVVRDRLNKRVGDASDADWNVHQQLAAQWEPIGPATQRFVHDVDTTRSAEIALASAMNHLQLRLCE